MAKKGWNYCCHCQGTGICMNKLQSIQFLFGFIPFITRSSDASCLAAAGADPTTSDFVVKCDVCKGTGYVYLNPEGYPKLKHEKPNSSK